MAAAAPSDPRSTAEAPSLSGEALPAVIVPSVWNTAERLGRAVRADSLVTGQVGVVDRNDDVVVEPVLPGLLGELVRAGGELVLALPGDREPLLQLLVGLAERDRPLLGPHQSTGLSACWRR
jgi:hypothetical protein